MKKLTILAFSLSLCTFIQAQIKVISSGDVAIGHDNPISKLDVEDGNARFRVHSDNNTKICAGNYGSGMSALILDAANGDFAGSDYFFLYQNDDLDILLEPLNYASGNIRFMTKTGSSLGDSDKESMRITRDGEVGIGYSSPSYTLDVDGIVRADNISPSDSTLKQNIDQISESKVSEIYSLSGKTYQLKKKTIPGEPDSISIRSYDTVQDDRFHFGLIAQEVQNYYPEIVYEDNNGILSLSYNDLIPILIEALKDQKNQIEDLKDEMEDLKAESINKSALTSKDINVDESSPALLYQNKPNPFNKDTEIQYYLPDHIKQANINIYTLSGTQIKNYLVTQHENGSLTIKAEELSPGMYLYSLIADGDLIDTRRMVLTDY